MGFARSKMTQQEFRDMITLTLTCRIDTRCVLRARLSALLPYSSSALTAPPPAVAAHPSSETCGPAQEEFIKRCFYCSGQYDDTASFVALSAELAKHEVGRAANRIFYLSIPPTVFVPVAQNAARCASSTTGFTRVIVEKPFGRDLESSRALGKGLAEALTEEQIYRCVRRVRRVSRHAATHAAWTL